MVTGPVIFIGHRRPMNMLEQLRYTREERVALSDKAIEAANRSDPDFAFADYVRGISLVFLQ